MSNAYLCPILQDSQFSDDDTFLAGGQIWFYQAGTSTPAIAYTGPNADTAWTNPIVLNARGETGGEIWLLSGQAYKLVVEGRPYYGEAHGPVVNTFDNISGVNDPSSVGSTANWVTFATAPVYVSSTSFSVSGDHRDVFLFGRRVKISKSSGYAYGMVVSATYSLSATTVVVSLDYGNSLNSSISVVQYGAIETNGVSSIPVGVYAGDYYGGSQYPIWIDYNGFDLQWAVGTNSASSNWPITADEATHATTADSASSASNGIRSTFSADLTSSRTFNTTYTNSGTTAMIVYITLDMSTDTNEGYAVIAGNNVFYWSGVGSNPATNYYQNMTLCVPAGATYSLTQVAGTTASITRWIEQN